MATAPATAPTLSIPAGAELHIGTDGVNDIGSSGLVNPLTGTPYDNTASQTTGVTCWLTIWNAANAAVQAQVQMTFVADGVELGGRGPARWTLPAHWHYTVASSVFVTGAGPWAIAVEVHGPGGVGDTLHRTLWANGVERDR